MTRRLWDWIAFIGVLCLLVGAAGVVFGYPGMSAQQVQALGVLGLILIGAGASAKGRAKKRS